MRTVMRALGLASLGVTLSSPSWALPDLWSPVGFDMPSNVVVYRDHEDPNLYYVLPNVINIAKDNGGNPMFSLQHRGVTAPDVDNVGGLVNFTATAAFHDKNFEEKVWTEYVKTHPGAKLVVLPGDSHYVEFFLQPELSNNTTLQSPPNKADPTKPTSLTIEADEDADVTTKSSAPEKLVVSIEKTQGATEGMSAAPPGNPFAFQASLNRIGARTLSFTDEDFGSIDRPLAMIVRYQYVYKGIGPRYKIKISVNWSRLYSYYQKNSSSSRWFGISRSQDTTITKDLKDNSVISYEILDGALTPSQSDEAAGSELFKLLSRARVEGTGMFKPAFQETNPGGGGGGGSGFLGWGSSSRSFEERLNQNLTTEFIIERKETEQRLHKIGFSIGMYCEEHPELFTNLTEAKPRCISPQVMDKLRKASTNCRKSNQDIWKIMNDKYYSGQMSKEQFTELQATAVNQCLMELDHY